MKKLLEKDTVLFSVNFSKVPWLQRLALWFLLKKLECQLRSSRRFQNYCQKIGCKNLTELEGQVGERIHKKIERLKTSFENKGLASKNLALNQSNEEQWRTGVCGVSRPSFQPEKDTIEIDKPQLFKQPTPYSQLSTKSFPLNAPIPKPQPK